MNIVTDATLGFTSDLNLSFNPTRYQALIPAAQRGYVYEIATDHP
jgi:hypothetical protein